MFELDIKEINQKEISNKNKKYLFTAATVISWSVLSLMLVSQYISNPKVEAYKQSTNSPDILALLETKAHTEREEYEKLQYMNHKMISELNASMSQEKNIQNQFQADNQGMQQNVQDILSNNSSSIQTNEGNSFISTQTHQINNSIKNKTVNSKKSQMKN